MEEVHDFDIVVIGSGPAGQKAAIQGAKAGMRVLVVEREKGVGGACVHRGTIPSKTLRETAIAFESFRGRTNHVAKVEVPEHVQLASLMSRLEKVTHAHEVFIDSQLQRNSVTELAWPRFVSFALRDRRDVRPWRLQSRPCTDRRDRDRFTPTHSGRHPR